MNTIRHILCFFPVIGDTKDAKRVDILQKAGFSVTVIAFERDYFVSRTPNCKIYILGKIENGKYLQRGLIMLKSIWKLRSQIKKCDLVYALSPDLAIYSYFASIGLKKPLVMDVADIRKIQVSKSLSGRLFRLVDKFVSNKCDLILVTSQAFITEYYLKSLKVKIKDNFILENKVDYHLQIPDQGHISNVNRKIRIGYFGVLRDNWTVNLLLNLLERFSEKFEVSLAGINMIDKYDLNSISQNYKGFNYSGPYRSPDDLINLYKDVDVITIFYPESTVDKDWFDAKKICRSNRFYEACYFKKPILAFSFSEDGKRVNELDIGLTFDDYNISEIIKSISCSVTSENISKWTQKMNSLSEDTYMFNNEPLQLKDKLTRIITS